MKDFDKQFRRTKIVVMLLTIFFLTFLFLFLNAQKSEIENRVGSKVILEKDTLMILDYSLINNNYKLSNGKEISFELAKKLKTIN